MKKLLILLLIFSKPLTIFSQVVPEKIKKENNYQEVKLFDKGKGFCLIEKFAMYPNGLDGINQHLIKTIKYPKKARKKKIEGVVIVQYTVNINGTISDIKIIKSVYSLLDKEAIRVIKLMELWEPAYQRGKPVKTTYNQSFDFKL